MHKRQRGTLDSDIPAAELDLEIAEPPKKKRGRPPGSRNKPALARDVVPPTEDARVKADYGSDPSTIISRQLTMLDWAQQVMRNSLLRAYERKTVELHEKDVVKLEKMSNAIVRAVDALRKSSDLAEELSSRMSPEQLLEAAIGKLEAQDAPTVRYAIRRLKAHLERVAPAAKSGEGVHTAASAIAELE